jgi:hypothetical protein
MNNNNNNKDDLYKQSTVMRRERERKVAKGNIALRFRYDFMIAVFYFKID